MESFQINVRLTQEHIDAIDHKRIELQPILGKIPNRSEVVRYALEQYLADGPKASKTASKQVERPKK